MADKSSRSHLLDAPSEMLPQNPPPWFVNSLAWLLISIFAVALFAAIVVKLPESVECPFVLVSGGGTDPIQAPRMAVVTRVCVVEGQSVKTGDPLFILRSDEIREWGTQLRTLTEDISTQEEGLTNAATSQTAQLEIKNAEIAQAQSEVSFREKYMTTSRDLVQRMEGLSKTGGISLVELTQHRLEVAEAEKDLSVAQRTLQQVQLERQQIETEYNRKRVESLSEIKKLKLRSESLRDNLVDSPKDFLEVRAPYAGIVISLAERNVGRIVQNGQELCQLAATDGKERVRLLIAEPALARLKPGQPVKLFLDAYPYQRYGIVNARLTWVSPSAIQSPEGVRFVAYAEIDLADLEKQKRLLQLRVGMAGEARIVTGRRSIIEFIFEPVRQLRENLEE